MVHDQLVSLLRHLPLYVHHPLEPRVQVDGQLLLRLGAPLANGEDVLVVPHHHQQLLPVAGAEVGQDGGVSQA